MKKEFNRKIVEYNDPKFQYSKLAEELAELLEICLKRVNKKPDYHPPLEKFSEEIGHVKLRMAILIEQEGIKEDVKKSIEEKRNKLLGWMEQGKYKGGL